jgi:integrase
MLRLTRRKLPTLAESYALKSGIDKKRIKSENPQPRDNRASAETLANPVTTLVVEPNVRYHTLAHVRCPACAESFGMQIELDPTIKFRDAAPRWLASRTPRLAQGSIEDYEKNILRLNQFFGEMRLQDIGIANIAAYQKDRIAGRYPFTRKAGPSRINHETMTLAQVLKRARLWKQFVDFYEPLPLPPARRGVALEPDEEKRLFELAQSKKRWKVGLCCWILTSTTSRGWSEIQQLRLRDINMTKKEIFIDRGKSVGRPGGVPLNESAIWAIQVLLRRAAKLGAVHPSHFLLPHRAMIAGHPADPTRPQGSVRKAWEGLRKAFAREFPHYDRLRQYDLRHHAWTKMLEVPQASEATAEAVGGHIPGTTKKIYSHPRRDARHELVAHLEIPGLTRTA